MVENSNICFMGIHWSHLWVVCHSFFPDVKSSRYMRIQKYKLLSLKNHIFWEEESSAYFVHSLVVALLYGFHSSKGC